MEPNTQESELVSEIIANLKQGELSVANLGAHLHWKKKYKATFGALIPVLEGLSHVVSLCPSGDNVLIRLVSQKDEASKKSLFAVAYDAYVYTRVIEVLEFGNTMTVAHLGGRLKWNKKTSGALVNVLRRLSDWMVLSKNDSDHFVVSLRPNWRDCLPEAYRLVQSGAAGVLAQQHQHQEHPAQQQHGYVSHSSYTHHELLDNMMERMSVGSGASFESDGLSDGTSGASTPMNGMHNPTSGFGMHQIPRGDWNSFPSQQQRQPLAAVTSGFQDLSFDDLAFTGFESVLVQRRQQQQQQQQQHDLMRLQIEKEREEAMYHAMLLDEKHRRMMEQQQQQQQYYQTDNLHMNHSHSPAYSHQMSGCPTPFNTPSMIPRVPTTQSQSKGYYHPTSTSTAPQDSYMPLNLF
eukprot:TRINITY_DN44891_c0_g5_i1.p1 TRINITY_DN44891_c0_g5~~TRINITY_DN44891_c0_g5_i1.p1  ORF type:complete len:406 (-),score=170.52 TRINITY_DN44891_c0_g5_i1:145-1362(-)